MITQNLLAFKKENTTKILIRLGNKVDKEGKVLDENNKPLTCHACKNKLTKDNLGLILPGSKILLCDNPACFTKYLAEKEEQEKKN